MSKTNTSGKSKLKSAVSGIGDGGMDWAAFDALTEEQVMAAALADPDAQPLTDEQLARMRRVALAKHVRWKLGLSQEDFARRFGIPIGTLRDWEQHRSKPDQAAESYLKVIAKNPKAVMKALDAAE
ncbi:MAG: helix-turn-helix domain-containing protein [Hyphomicrobium sp.]